MHRLSTRLLAVVTSAAVLAAGAATVAASRDQSGRHDGVRSSTFRAVLIGYEEVPAVSTTASGRFTARLDRSGTSLRWRLTYRNLEAPVQQAHIHFGQRAVDGGVSVFMCSNLPGAPAGVQRCPAPPATVTGTVRAQDVVGPAAQGIEPGALGELVAAMRAGVTYANVHSDKFPDGEIRGQIGRGR